MYLAAAGVGRIGIVDFDVVDHSNLQRQVIHGTSWVGKPKIESAKARILEINPHCQVDLYETALSSENALEIVRPYDIVCDGTDNFPTRYLVNDACVILKKPNVYGSIFRFEGQSTIYAYPGGPCYRCSYPEPPPPGLVPSCAEGGVLDPASFPLPWKAPPAATPTGTRSTSSRAAATSSPRSSRPARSRTWAWPSAARWSRWSSPRKCPSRRCEPWPTNRRAS